jgi:integrase/recombinase XerD
MMSPLRKRMIGDMQLRNFTPETQRTYLHHIFHLARFYQTSPEQLNLDDLREYQLYLINGRNLSPESVNQFVSAATFLYTVTLEVPWPEHALPRARVPHRLPVVLSRDEVDLFFRHVPSLRCRAALMTCYGAGLRVSEVVSLRVPNVDSKRMLIHIQSGKGQKDRYTLLPQRVLEVLRTWFRAARPDPKGWLFPSWRPIHHMSAATLQLACKEAAARAGLAKRVTVHTMRHSFATHMLEDGNDTRIIQALLGHSQISTTQRYTRVSPELAARVISPLDRSRKRGPGRPPKS